VTSPLNPFKKDSKGNILSYELKVFPNYFEQTPYISRVIFHFYPTEDALVDAYNRREILGMAGVSATGWERVKDQKSATLYELRQPRLFAVFFNEVKSVPLGYTEVRRALALGIDREALVRDVLAGHGEALSTPLMPGMIGFDTQDQIGYDPDQAAKLLDDAGWKLSGDIRKKGDKELAFELVTPDWADLVKTAEGIKSQWERLGVRVTIKTVGVAELQQTVIRPREYQALLFGEVSSFNPDPYSFWHSSQKNDPGTNFSLFDNQDVDDALATARETLDESARINAYRVFESKIKELAPAAFLYSPHYLYVVNHSVQGIDVTSINLPSDRLDHFMQWFMETKRVKK
jgi:peptide/nickel transport system substrate-binding protein